MFSNFWSNEKFSNIWLNESLHFTFSFCHFVVFRTMRDFSFVLGTRPKRRSAITAQSHNLLQDFRILTNLVSNDSSHRAEEIGTKIDKFQKFSSKLWLCAIMAARRFGLYLLFFTSF
uniref:Uncharacterized protein n=1 Tax=Meloidogyne enterolobii TaxID=390850 RepID=A0A6V7V8E1_MELEN|nr:unnamed protein product [Meloidogyne enterolobii]